MAPPKKTAKTRLTAKEQMFVDLFCSDPEVAGNATQSVMRAYNYKEGAAQVKGVKLKKMPHIQAAIEKKNQIKFKADQAKDVARAKAEGKRQGLERAEHFELLAQIARNPFAVPTARVKAIVASAELKGMMIHKTANLSDEFQGRTPDECEFFAEHGYWPEAAKPVESGDAGAATATSAGPEPGEPNKP